MAGISVRAIGFWFFIINLVLALITLILSVVKGVLAYQLAVSLMALFINITWLVLQIQPSCRFSGLQFGAEGDSEPYRRFVPRWAVTILLAFFYFVVAVSASDSSRRYGYLNIFNDTYSSLLAVAGASAIFSFMATAAYVAEFFISCIMPNRYDGL